MKFKIDENLPVEVADRFRSAGYDAVTVLMQGLGGASDNAIAKICREENRVLITLDVDFADIRVYPPAQYPGVIVLRLSRQDKPHVLKMVDRLISILAKTRLERQLWIVEETRLRIRS